MSLNWYINRLRSMEAAEILHRVAERGKRIIARNRLEGWGRFEQAGGIPVLPGLREPLAAANSDDYAAIATAAQSQREGLFSALGVEWPRRVPSDVFPAELWRLDPVTGGYWPGNDKYCFDIAYRHERRLGDIKYVWEINRLQFLQPLAADVYLTGNTESLGIIEAAINSWFEANPPFRGITWNSGIELALRAISLLVVTSLCGEDLSPATIDRVRAILHAHAFWMARYPSLFSSANNHLVAELAGEFLIALAMPELPLAHGLSAKGRRLLVVEANKQILADGVPAEQSPTYGAFTGEFLLLCAYCAQQSGQPLGKDIDDRLGLLAQFLGWISSGQGLTPKFCDDDDGRVLTLCQPDNTYAISVASAICAYLGKPAPGGSGRDLRNVVLPATQRIRPPMELATFASGGYTVVRSETGGHDYCLIVDHAPLGYLGIAAHGHADALSFVLNVDTAPVFVDPGTYLYHSGGDWRDWFRGTRAHNTLTVNGADQSLISGAFNWSHKAETVLDEVVDGDAWRIRATHDGYEQRFKVRHERTFAATSNGFTILDRLTGANGPNACELVFQLDESCDAVLVEPHKVVISRNSKPIVRLELDDSGKVGLSRGGDEMDGGWISNHFGVKRPATRIQWTGRVPATARANEIMTRVNIV